LGRGFRASLGVSVPPFVQVLLEINPFALVLILYFPGGSFKFTRAPFADVINRPDGSVILYVLFGVLELIVMVVNLGFLTIGFGFATCFFAGGLLAKAWGLGFDFTTGFAVSFGAGLIAVPAPNASNDTP
jgi:hypothetical protein